MECNNFDWKLPGRVDVENNKRDDGNNDVKCCVQPEYVDIYIPVINPKNNKECWNDNNMNDLISLSENVNIYIPVCN